MLALLRACHPAHTRGQPVSRISHHDLEKMRKSMRNKKLLVAKGIATSTRASLIIVSKFATSNKKLLSN